MSLLLLLGHLIFPETVYLIFCPPSVPGYGLVALRYLIFTTAMAGRVFDWRPKRLFGASFFLPLPYGMRGTSLCRIAISVVKMKMGRAQ